MPMYGEIGARARRLAEAAHGTYPPIATAAEKLAMVAEQGTLEFCCEGARREPVIWYSWHPREMLCEIHAVAASASSSGIPETVGEPSMFCDGCGGGPFRDITMDTFDLQLTEQLLIVAALCDRCLGSHP
jgi:hypothetical protein